MEYIDTGSGWFAVYDRLAVHKSSTSVPTHLCLMTAATSPPEVSRPSEEVHTNRSYPALRAYRGLFGCEFIVTMECL